jgi:uncharacterized protein
MSIWSPCNKVCFVDPDAEICVGCFRSMEELGRWTKMTDTERKAVGDALPARERAYRASKGKPAPKS